MGQKNEEKSAVLDLDQGFKIVELKKALWYSNFLILNFDFPKLDLLKKLIKTKCWFGNYSNQIVDT